MTYKLERPDKGYCTYIWTGVFSCLSLKQFDGVYEMLEFPFLPTSQVHQLAHDFSLTINTLMNWQNHSRIFPDVQRHPIYGTTSYNLLQGTTPKDTYFKKKEALFTNTFSILEEWGYAESIYEWGKTIRNYIRFHNRQKYLECIVLKDWSWLLLRWAIAEWINNPIYSKQNSSKWEAILNKKISSYKKCSARNSTMFKFEEIPLTISSRQKLLPIVFDTQSDILFLRETIDLLFLQPETLWEQLLFRNVSTWLRLEGRYRFNLHMYHQIIKILSPDELRKVGDWGMRHIEKHPSQYAKSTTSLADFRFLGAE